LGSCLGFSLQGPGSALPIVDEIPTKATEIPVTSPGLTENINFVLPSVELADLIDNLTSVSDPEISLVPDEFQLSQNYPNPFNPGTVINYHVPINSEVTLTVYNMLGQRIRVLFDGIQEASVHTATWDGRDDQGREVAAGLYFVRLRGEDVTLTRKMLLVR